MKILKPLLLSSLLFTLLLLAIAPSFAQEPATSPAYVPGEILVKFVAPKPPQQGLRALSAAGLRVAEVSPYSGIVRVKVTPGREAETIAALQARGEVRYATLNYILTAFDPPNDSEFSKQWGLHNTGLNGATPDADIDALEAWDITTGSNAVIIAIVDSGVDLDHPDLQANLMPGYDFVNDDADPDDDFGHGTHVAGIAAAVGNNGIGVSGVSRNAKIMPVKVLNSGGIGSVSSIVNGIDYAVANGADIINLSLGAAGTSYPCVSVTPFPYDFTPIQEAMQRALDNNVLVVAAAGNGNESFVNCPAAYDEALAVGATNYNDSRWVWNSNQGSNQGDRLSVVAPGGSASSLDLTTGIYSTESNGGYGYKSGTSMSTPHVAGLAALLWSYNPNLTQAEVHSVIESTADDLGPVGFDIEYGHGRINTRRALEALNDFQITPSQINFLADNITDPMALPNQIQITSLSPETEPISWTAVISPAVTWLAPVSPTTGTVSVSSPAALTLTATRPATYGLYNTTVIVSGKTAAGAEVGIRQTKVYLQYTYAGAALYLPMIVKP